MILEDRSFTFSIFLPTTGFILSFLKIQQTLNISNKKLKKNIIFFKDLVQLALLKFPELSLFNSIPIILGSVNSCNILVFKL